MSLSRGLISDRRDEVSRPLNTDLLVNPVSVGKYVLRCELGRGGMGIVYEGEDTLLERLVAIKLLAPHCADERALARLLREARSAARLNHPNAVAVYDVGEHASGIFIAMELIRGANAWEYLQRFGPFRWPDATRIVAEICQGLAAAHAAGLIHRDIKPANIMLVESAGPHFARPTVSSDSSLPLGSDSRVYRPWAKLADFGLSRSLNYTAPVTLEGQVVGTPHYMSPEQIRGEQLDERADLYSLGATYYTLLTGRFPFERDDVIQILFAHCSAAPPDPTRCLAELPPGCAQVIAKAMAKEPRHRYASADAFLADVQDLLVGQAEALGLPTRSLGNAASETISSADTQADLRVAMATFPRLGSSRRRMTALLIAGCSLLMLLLSVLVVINWQPAREAVATSRAVHQPVQPQPAPALQRPALAPIAMQIEQSWSRSRNGSIAVDGELELIRLSPDQRVLAWGITEGEQQHGRLTLFDLDRREIVGMYLDDSQYAAFSCVAFAGDRFVLLACSHYVIAVDRETQTATTLIKLEDGSARSIDVTPDLSRLVLGIGEWDDGGRVEIYDLAINGDNVVVDNRRRALQEHTTAVKAVAYSHDGKQLAAASENGQVLIGDGLTGQTRQQGRLPEPIGEWGEVGYSVEFSPDSRWVAAGGHQGVVMWDTHTGARRLLPTEHARRIQTLTFSRSGKYVASGSTDGIRLWNVEQGCQVGETLAGHDGNVIMGLAFANDDSLLISAAFDRRLKFWNLSPQVTPPSSMPHE